jgi:ribokinase
VTTLLNLAPVPPGAPALLACRPDWLVVNSQEAGALAAGPVTGAAGARRVAAALAGGDGARNVVITLGAEGAVLAGPAGDAAVPGFAVEAVDSVGAGDAFVGALAVALAAGAGPAGAVRAACAAGAAAATRRGAQPALPRPADLAAATGFTWPFADVPRQAEPP